MNIYTKTLICLSVTMVLIAPSCAATTPFMICGWSSYNNGTDCDNLAVSITNPDNGKTWTAETSGNYFQIMLTSGIDLNATEILRFDATDGVYSSVTDHTVTAKDVGDGGLFEFNITLGSIPGDVNDDGHLTTADAAIVLTMAVSGEYSKVADVSGDGAVTSLDALMILQEIGTESG
ncbi:MAG: dockerin type I repeat-containing protein [Euryarchaeota archaeon]|nr:dockerin type I repeat-containing protein [Euryarchaeota archaeon]